MGILRWLTVLTMIYPFILLNRGQEKEIKIQERVNTQNKRAQHAFCVSREACASPSTGGGEGAIERCVAARIATGVTD